MNGLKALSVLTQKRTEGVQTYLFQLMQNVDLTGITWNGYRQKEAEQ